MAVFLDDQIAVEELSRFLNKNVGEKIVPDESELNKEEDANKPTTYKYLNIIKSFELIVGVLPSAPAASMSSVVSSV